MAIPDKFTKLKPSVGIEKRFSKLKKIKEAVLDYEAIVMHGQLMELMTVMTEFKTRNKQIRWYCCIEIHRYINILQEQKNFTAKEIMEIFTVFASLDEDKVLKVLAEAKEKGEQYEKETFGE